jgi:hypothetical protein
MLINRAQEIDLALGRGMEARTFGGLAHTHEWPRATKAFLEKRKSNFTGN